MKAQLVVSAADDVHPAGINAQQFDNVGLLLFKEGDDQIDAAQRPFKRVAQVRTKAVLAQTRAVVDEVTRGTRNATSRTTAMTIHRRLEWMRSGAESATTAEISMHRVVRS